ncbi:adenylyl cyclase-associated protein 1 [Planococcus citri]|uniref:adenylyl cyclase-associated protein 1 n=1 Tax=Planococcus citri TaxID=170843 RepID=UPI0031F8840C
MSVQAYSDIIQSYLSNFITYSNQIGGDVAEQAKLVSEAFKAQLEYLKLAAQSALPSADQLVRLLKPTSDKIQAIQSLREKNRASQYFNHLSAISESIPALGWVTVSPAPGPYIKEMNDAGQFYTNRVLKDWKEKDKKHVDWVKSWIEVLTEMQKFVKQFHTTGLVWSGKSAVGGIPPPPPGNMPPPPPVLPDLNDLSVGDKGDDRSALFAEINQGENITKALKKVTPDMQTHKNPNLRSGPAPFKATSTTGTNYSGKPAVEKSPVFQRDGKKWIIEYYKDNHGLLVEGTEMNNVVYMFNCTNCTLTVKGKINSIFLDSCRKSSVVFDTVVSSAEFVNCQSVQMQVLGNVPTISIDKTDGCQMYLSEKSLGVEIVSSKSSEMNVLIPKGNGDYSEYPIAEQFKTTISPSGLKTVVIESKG